MQDSFRKFRHIHLVGSGGVGMFAIGGILLERNISVSGSDLEKNPKSEFLRSLGAKIFYGHTAGNLPPETDAVIYTSAAAADNPELVEAAKRQIPCYRRGQFLAEEIVPVYQKSAAIAGSHGKSTVSAMVTHILRKLNVKTGCLIGGALQDGSLPFGAGDGSVFITEADESDHSHSLLHPTVAVITNYDADHAWTAEQEKEQFEKFQLFCRNAEIIVHYDLPSLNEISEPFADKRIVIPVPDKDTVSPFCGFMKLNAVLALKVAETLGFKADMQYLADFKGVDRRMRVHCANENQVLLEDYAHHPAELAAALDYLRELYPEHKLHVIFQPHRYARLKKYFSDFVQVLDRSADKVFVAPVFAAWNESGSPDSKDLAAALANGEYLAFDDTNKLRSVWNAEQGAKVLTAVIGAGDVEKLIPLLKKDVK